MSKRGRRRSSKRRKSSSSSSKQSVSPYIFQKLNRNNVSYKDDIVEKGETDSLRKENVVSGSEDEEKSDNAPPKEKRFKQDYPSDSLLHPRSVHTSTTSSSTSEDGEQGVSIVTSVSLSDVEDSAFPRILVQQSHEPMSERPMSSTSPVTNTLKINCSAPHVQLEIRETLQLRTAGIKTTFVVMDHSSQEIFFKSECERTWMPNNESPEQAVPSMMPAVFPPSPPLLFNIRPPGKRKSFERSFSSDHFYDIPPPPEFADVQLNPFDHLSAGLASCRLGAQSPADQEPQEFQPGFFEGFRSPFSVQANLAPSLDQLSESDNYEPMFMRPSFSTNRSSFTKDFISCQKRRSWIRNNSIATVERRTFPVPRKRRQTFPGTSQDPGTMYDDFPLPYSDSFSSLFTCSLPFQTERLSRIQCDDRFSPFGIGNCVSPQRKGSCKPESGIPDSYSGKQALLSPFYVTSSEENPEDLFSVHEVCARLSSSTLQDQDFKRSLSKDTESPDMDDGEYKADQREFVDSGFDQEILEVDHLREAVVGQRSLAIQITPPSCSGSEEHMMESHPVPLYNNNNHSPLYLCPEPRKTSVTIMTAGDPEHRFLQLGSSSHRIRVPTSQDLDSNGSNTEETEGEPVGEKQASSSSSQPEEKDLQVDSKDDAESPGTVVAVAGAAGAMEPPSAPDRGGRRTVFRPCVDFKDHLRPVAPKEADGSGSADHWAKRRKLFKESKQWSSAGGSSITSDITEESEDTRSVEVTEQDDEDRGFYMETFHSSAWIFHGDDADPEGIHSSLSTRTRAVSIRDRTVKINKGTGEYPWGFRIQFSKPIVVTEVDTNGAAEEAGLMVGDYVLAVNGIDVTSIPHSEAADLARQGPDILTLTIGSDIARVPNTPRPACRGYLHKRTQSGLIKGWRKRWFVLRHDCCLYYYRHKRDEGKRQALSMVKLEGAEVGADVSLGKPFVFRCRPLTGNRVFFFWAPSNQEMKRWLEAMQKAIHPITQNHVWVDVTRHNSNLPPLAVKNPDCLGLLHKMDKSQDTWLQHYCILKDGCLYMYSGIRATHAHGGIYLQGYMVREQPHGSKKSTIELKPPSDEFKTFHLCAENATENKRWILAIRASIKKWLYLHQALQDYMSRPPEETRM